jgi:hypothetical protein
MEHMVLARTMPSGKSAMSSQNDDIAKDSGLKRLYKIIVDINLG